MSSEADNSKVRGKCEIALPASVCINQFCRISYSATVFRALDLGSPDEAFILSKLTVRFE